jgi:hypothetical protein
MPWDGLGPAPATCDEICESQFSGPQSCVARGCANLTALVCESYEGQWCPLLIGQPADVEFAGECDEPIPWSEQVDGSAFIYCCCTP